MSKKAGKKDSEEAKSPGKFQVFLLIFLVPAVFLVFASVIVLTLLDINPIKEAEEAGIEIPFLTDKKAEQESGTIEDSQQIASLESQLKEKEGSIAELENKLETQTSENEKLAEEQDVLLQEMESLRSEQGAKQSESNEMVSVFEEMKGKTAAPVLLNMDEGEAVVILSQLPADAVASIFEEMPPEEAAKYAGLLGIDSP
ncbi:hypothetical protein P6709_00940 [Jeotgalibacillus sp. ET6]|uniref:MotE family protein n=1 Tax=Jeotgalibacillus sp. ET6 TaxID=3037260 RepID=UPI0024187572|nr:hypothetical protein [Jeotgalibacillus sp. ET6]MDG5470291.1 hypothetical protein [Jeotgalibacillus sp. ET6]